MAAAVAAETRVESPPVALPSAESLASQPAPPAFVPVAFEAHPARPGHVRDDRLVVPSAPAGALLAQAPSGSATPAPPLDPEPQEYDPWESFNEKMFTFNYKFDKYLLKPVAKGYNVVMPDELQRMISNAFDNINPVPKWANNLLQRKYKGFFTSSAASSSTAPSGSAGSGTSPSRSSGCRRPTWTSARRSASGASDPAPSSSCPSCLRSPCAMASATAWTGRWIRWGTSFRSSGIASACGSGHGQ